MKSTNFSSRISKQIKSKNEESKNLEKGITKANIDSWGGSKDAEIHRLLGTGDTDILAMMGMPKNALYNAIKAGGNYGEIFENNLGATGGINIERGVNASWTKGGILYSPPFR